MKIAKIIIQDQTITKTVMIIIVQIDLEIIKITETMKIVKETIGLTIAKAIITVLIITVKMEIINLITKIETDKDHLIEIIMEDL